MDGKFLTFLWGEPPQRSDEATALGVLTLGSRGQAGRGVTSSSVSRVVLF